MSEPFPRAAAGTFLTSLLADPTAPVIPAELPILPLRNLVLFPGAVASLDIGRPESIQLLESSLPASKVIGLIAQRDPAENSPGSDDLHAVGTVAMVLKLVRPARDAVTVVVQGLQRFRVRRFVQAQPFLRAEAEILHSTPGAATASEAEAALRHLRGTLTELAGLEPELPAELRLAARTIDDAGVLADFAAANLDLAVPEKQALLEELDIAKRLQGAQQRVSTQLEIARIQKKLQADVSSHFTDLQRRAYLREQLRAIQRELGEGENEIDEQIDHLRKRLEEAAPPRLVMDQAERELKRLHYVAPASAEFSVIVSYVETLAELPWSKLSPDNLDLPRAREILDRDHFGLEKVKRRLIEFLAVRQLNPAGHGPILCFFGPPGVGKTSLGQSVADALGRRFSRLSLGGLRDEAEIRGHRRTYIGAMPGRLIQELRRLGTRNPVLMLDEIDKLGSEFRGDPASALLEVLDPQQNRTFVDHYLDVPFDLSQVIFITTANILDPMPPALRDRMEIIEISGYTDHEKLEIASRYLVVRQLRENGLQPDQCRWDRAALNTVIEDYTRESGVRELERQIGSVCRALAAEVATGEAHETAVTPSTVRRLLGPAKYLRESRLLPDRPGFVMGLAYTPYGGEVLTIESACYPGTGQITLTGQIGHVMKESAQAALSLLRSRGRGLDIETDSFRHSDIHIHVPSGAVPKDGPSAGIAIFTALASLFTQIPVRTALAMTGEITLRGSVLPIGGLKEKCLAAMRAGVTQIIIPRLNEKDLAEVPAEVKEKVEIIPVDNVDQVLDIALTPALPGTEAQRPAAGALR